MLYLCKVLWVMELVCDVCPLGGVRCEFWYHSLFTLCHYALYCIADHSSRGFLSPLGMVRMFPVRCRCVVVYPDTPIHTSTQLEKSSPSPKSIKIRVNYNQQYKKVHSETSDLHQHSVNSERRQNSQHTPPRGQTSHTNSMTHKTLHRYNM